MIRTTLFRQTMFAEFEYVAHDSCEKGIPLTKDFLNGKYLELNKKYYGDGIVSDDEIAYEWARIPHFYNSFYVYKYATGISAAMALADRVTNGGESEREDYFKFLKSGGSRYPIESLKVAGVDMSKTEPIQKALDKFKEIVDELEKLI